MPGLRRLSSHGSTLRRTSRSHEKLRPRMSFDDDPVYDSDSGESDVSAHGSAQAGVKKLEATASLWSKWSLGLAYAG